MLGSRIAITMYYVLAAGLPEVLERCLLGWMPGSPDFVRCRPRLGLGFSINFCISTKKLWANKAHMILYDLK